MQWMSPEDRRKLGQARRKQVRRQEHANLKVKRPLSARELLERAARGRIAQLVKLKFQLMAESPFAYFRGAAAVMAADLSVLPNTGIVTQICGDAHVRNLGAFAAPDGSLVFDINDFDETIRAPFEWDLKRMAASLVLAGREAGYKERPLRDAVTTCVAQYTDLMRTFARMPAMEVSRFQVRRIAGVDAIHQALVKAERATPLHNLEKLTEPAGEEKDECRQFRQDPPRLRRLPKRQAAEILGSLGEYSDTLEPQRAHLLSLYRPIDVAFKVVGVGSVGMRDYCVYFLGNGAGDPLFLQIKEETESVYAPYIRESGSAHAAGRRVVDGQRAMQLQSDPFLGWTRIAGRDYVVRQLNDHKGGVEVDDLAGGGLEAFAAVCGELLARGHARAGDPLVLAGYLGTGHRFADALADFGVAYADQTEKDWHDLRRASHLQSGQARSAARRSKINTRR